MENTSFEKYLAAKKECVTELSELENDYQEEKRLIMDAFYEDVDNVVKDMTSKQFSRFMIEAKENLDIVELMMIYDRRLECLERAFDEGMKSVNNAAMDAKCDRHKNNFGKCERCMREDELSPHF